MDRGPILFGPLPGSAPKGRGPSGREGEADGLTGARSRTEPKAASGFIMSRVTHYAYLPEDFGGTLPADPFAAAQTEVSLPVTLGRSATPVEIVVEDGRLTRGLRIAGEEVAPGGRLTTVWTLVDVARGIRISGLRIEAVTGPVTAVAAMLPLKPGQSLNLSLPVLDEDGRGIFIGGFGAGTRILTETGKRPIDEIAVGEKIWTGTDGFQPVIWHGMQSLPARGIATPVRIRRGVLGLTDDLLVSAGQGVQIDTAQGPVLVPAAALVAANRASWDFGARITWHQLLLPTHAVIFAQGLGCESLWSPVFDHGPKPEGWPTAQRLAERPALPRLTMQEARPLIV